MGRMQRQKGKRGERECAAELNELLGSSVNARRGVQYQGGPDSPDVVLDGVPIHVECKRTESLSIYTAMEQAKADAKEGSTPIVWHRRNGKPSLVIVETAKLVELSLAIADTVRNSTKCDPQQESRGI